MGSIVEDGLWCDVPAGESLRGRPGLFLDRDGTLIEHVHYLADPDAVRLIADAVDAVRRANAAGWAVVIVTNQSGVGRGLYGWAEVEAVQARTVALAAAAGGRIDASFAAGHAPPDAGGPDASPWRKPAPGMFVHARDTLGIRLGGGTVAGDGAHDLAAGKAAGLARGILVSTGYGAEPGQQAAALALAAEGFDVTVGRLSRLEF